MKEYVADNRLSHMTEDEIIALFDRYKFRDEHGHDLIYCQDFIDLIALASGSAAVPS